MEHEAVKLPSGTADQLHSPRCYVQKSIRDFLHTKSFDVEADEKGEDRDVVELVPTTSKENTDVSIPPIILSIPPNSDEVIFSTTPPVGRNQNQTSNEEVGDEDDNCGKVMNQEQTSLNDCVLNKKGMWCSKHECGLKCYNVSSKTWQYSKTKMKYMYVTKNAKKYVCLSKCGRQVQPMVTDSTGRKQTMPEASNLRESNGTVNDDHSGADMAGSVRISRSAGK